MLLAEGQGVIAHYAGRTGPAKIDRYYPGPWQAITGTDGWWLAPVMVHVDDLTPIPEDDEQRHRAAVALRAIGERSGFDWERTIALSVAAVERQVLPEEMTLAELAAAQQAVWAEAKRTNGFGRRTA